MNARYIKATLQPSVDSVSENTAPRFRKSFSLPRVPVTATLHCTGLGYGYFYLNGKPVTEDLFTAPVSDYCKTVWYTSYDVLPLLRAGDNVLAAILGNGFYNETFTTTWEQSKAPWRDVPKLFARLELTFSDGETQVLESDDTWRCTERSPYLFNALRSGEIYDARLREPGWTETEFDDSSWQNAFLDPTPPTGVLRQCTCAPIREFEVYAPEAVRKVRDGYVFCFPQNISGYIRLHAGYLKSGQEITIRYAEGLHPDGTLNDYENPDHYPGADYAFNRFIANGEDFVWQPRFSYYGFRYVLVSGLTEQPPSDILEAVFVHQAVPQKASFSCGNEKLNRLYRMGIYASWCNLFYMPTDCPTREKMGYGNDATASMEQLLMDFRCEDLMRKWFRDVLDSVREDGELPCIIPTGGFGYERWSGPACSGILFELPWQIYRQTGRSDLLLEALPYFHRHLARIRSMANEKGFPDYGLCDWAGPWEYCESSPVPKDCTNTLLYIKFLRITALTQELAGQNSSETKAEEQRITDLFIREYFREDGRMRYHEQTSLAMALVLDVYRERAVTAAQLVEVIERDNRHLNSGMLGMQYLYDALEKAGRLDLAWEVVTAEGFPGYFSWITERDATTFCEMFSVIYSQNHHMYTNVLAWMLKALAGIRLEEPGYRRIRIQPYFPNNLPWCKATLETTCGTVTVHWTRTAEGVEIKTNIPEGMEAVLVLEDRIVPLHSGENQYT